MTFVGTSQMLLGILWGSPGARELPFQSCGWSRALLDKDAAAGESGCIIKRSF